MDIFKKDKSKDAPERTLEVPRDPARVESIQGAVKVLTSESPGKVKATIVLDGGVGEIRINGKRFKIGESVRVSITAED